MGGGTLNMKNMTIALSISAFLFACSNGPNSSFTSDTASSLTCASSGCAPVDTYATMSLKKTSTYYAKISDREVEINGDCFIADSVSHTISLSLKQGATPFAVSIRGLNAGNPADTAVQCSQGKFSVIVTVSTLTAGIYNLTGQMNLVKSDKTHSSPSSASFTANLSLSN